MDIPTRSDLRSPRRCDRGAAIPGRHHPPTTWSRRGLALASLSLGAALGPAQAQTTPPGDAGRAYVGIALGAVRSGAKDGASFVQVLQGQGLTVRGTGSERRSTGGKLYVGYRVNPHLAIEGGLTELGRSRFQGQVVADPGRVEASVRVRDWNLLALGIVPLAPGVEVYGKAGLGHWQARLSMSGTFSGASAQGARARGTGPIAGLGALWQLNPEWALRLEGERYFRVGTANGTGRSDIDLLSVGAQYSY